MRVRVVKPTTTYWNYAVQSLEPPLEADGELARHLADNAPAGGVEVIEDDRKEARAAAARAAEMAKRKDPPAPEDDPKKLGGGDGGGGNPSQTPAPDPDGSAGPKDPDAPPVDGTADALFTWVDGDREKAARALEAEQAKDRPRSTVVKRLSALAGADDE